MANSVLTNRWDPIRHPTLPHALHGFIDHVREKTERRGYTSPQTPPCRLLADKPPPVEPVHRTIDTLHNSHCQTSRCSNASLINDLRIVVYDSWC